MRITLRRRLLAAAVPLTLLAPIGAAAGPAAAAPPAPAPCPAAYPLGSVHAGMSATGWTTSSGRTPAAFSARVLGVLSDAIAPGIDMIVVRTDSAAVRQAGGIWQGMSGSPVYAADGRLLGAVSYGLSYGPSATAGLTPAAAMYRMLSMTTAAPRVAHPRLTPALRRAVVRSGAASPAQAASGMQPLTTPVTVSGVPAGHLPALARQLRHSGLTGFALHPGGGARAGAVATAAPPGPGAPFAVALATGDYTAAGVGTVTAVCAGQVLAFGHPMLFSGRSTAAANAATVLYVQDDPLGTPFVVANIAGQVGAMTQDRLVGVVGRLGAAPAARTTIRVQVAASTGLRRTGTTVSSVVDQVPPAVPSTIYSDLLATQQQQAAGSATLDWTVTGHAAGYGSWQLHRSDHVADTYDVAYAAADPTFLPLVYLADNPFRSISFDRVSATVHSRDVVYERRLTAVRVRRAGAWQSVAPGSTIHARAGELLRLQVTLRGYRENEPPRTAVLRVRVPARASGWGSLQLSGGEDLAGSGPSPDEATSFANLLARLRAAPTDDSVVARLDSSDGLGNPVSAGAAVRLLQAARGTVTLAVVIG